MAKLKSILIAGLLSLLTACTTSHRPVLAPVEDAWHQPESKQGVVVVQHDDESLYAIAWRYGHDYREIAAINHLSAPYHLSAGQRLSLVPTTRVITISKRKVSLRHKSLAQPVEVGDWHWPTVGKIIRTYNPNGPRMSKGIDIAAPMGTPVVAANGGVVVYSGHGLRGYGNLIIIKHSDEFLSAYAHNKRNLVQEGQHIKAKQKIAEVGNTEAKRPELHFEIRKAGQPVDPLDYLPNRH